MTLPTIPQENPKWINSGEKVKINLPAMASLCYEFYRHAYEDSTTCATCYKHVRSNNQMPSNIYWLKERLQRKRRSQDFILKRPIGASRTRNGPRMASTTDHPLQCLCCQQESFVCVVQNSGQRHRTATMHASPHRGFIRARQSTALVFVFFLTRNCLWVQGMIRQKYPHEQFLQNPCRNRTLPASANWTTCPL